MNKLTSIIVVLSFILTGCANLTNVPGLEERGIDGVSCVGNVISSVNGLAESVNPALLAKARMQTGKGGVCAAKVFAAIAPVVLYRVFDGNKPYTKFGSWWSLQHPGSSKDAYREANAICPEWSKLDRVVACEVRPGTQIVLGTTQSAQCRDGTLYAKTAAIQVFVANDSRAGIIHIGHCSKEQNWP